MSSENKVHTGRGIAWTRHHRARLANKRKGYFVFQYVCPEDSDRLLGILVSTPKACSCWMCGNPRRYKMKGKTPEEMRADLALKDGLLESGLDQDQGA